MANRTKARVVVPGMDRRDPDYHGRPRTDPANLMTAIHTGLTKPPFSSSVGEQKIRNRFVVNRIKRQTRSVTLKR